MPLLDDLLARSAVSGPDLIALIEDTGRTTSYAALNALADRICGDLATLGIGPGDRVGISAQKSPETVAALFAIMRLGAAYVPVDPTAPAARSAGIFADCAVRAVLVADQGHAALAEELAPHGYATATAPRSLPGFAALIADGDTAKSPDLAYILYTSGSTGKPKGVSHSHASAMAFVDWCSAAFAPRPTDRFSSHAPFHFDLSILDLYVPLKHGAAVRLISSEEARQPGALARLIETDRITNWYSTPTILRAMVEHTDLASFDHASLKVVCFAGEVFATKHLKALAEIWSHPAYFNLFGPTETNVCTAHALTDPRKMDDGDAVPIGIAASDDLLRITDENGAEVSPGTEGELLVSGGSVMRGYWNAPERTAEAFATHDGQRWYRTGDVVVARPDGALMYRGRRDRMVKRRGYRVELGEIEAQMLRHEHVTQCAAVAVADAEGAVTIVTFLAWSGAGKASTIALKKYASQVLPAYMIPDRFVAVETLPYTSTDKIDYTTLKERAHGFLAK